MSSKRGECTRCRQANPKLANFCSRCGANLRDAEGVRSSGRGGSGLVFIGVLLASASLFITISIASSVAKKSDRRPPVMPTRRAYDLPKHKAEAFFEMLAPKRVNVVVRRQGQKVAIKGSEAEAGALDDFVELISRYDHLDHDEVHRAIEQATPTWTVSKRYKFASRQADALWVILASDDVPVLVSRSGRRLSVRGAASDMRLLDCISDILHGRRVDSYLQQKSSRRVVTYEGSRSADLQRRYGRWQTH